MATKLSKDKAVVEVTNIIKKENSRYDLVVFSDYRNGKRLRSDRYNSFLFLCHANTYKNAGWLVCKYAVTGGCKLSSAVLVFNTLSGGTSRFERHMAQHNSSKSGISTISRSLPQFSKTQIARSAALSVALDLRPLSFTDGKKGLIHLANSLFKAGQAIPISDNIDPASLLLCTKTVMSALTKLANERRAEYKSLLPHLIHIGGGVATDGVALKVQGKHFYDFTLHYIEFSQATPFDPTPKFSMSCRTLLLQEKTGCGNAEQIRGLLGNALREQYSSDIDSLTEGFTMVTDNASVMARVANSSVSERVAPVNEKWMGCLAHQLNTAMKCCISELGNQNELLPIFNDVQSVKKIVRIFKQSNFNSLLPDGLKLIQEIDTRFGKTFLVVQRFLKSFSHVEVFQSNESSAAKVAYDGLTRYFSAFGGVSFPALEAVIDAFQGVIELQTTWEASHYPTIHTALPRLQICIDKLQSIVDGGSVWRGGDNGFIPASRLSRQMCRTTVEWLEAKVRMHPLVMAACCLNPLFREFQFLSDLNKRRTYRSGGEAMVRSLMVKLHDDGDSSHTDSTETQQLRSTAPKETDAQPPVVGRKRAYSLLEYADSHFQPTTANDEVSRYKLIDISQLPIEKPKYVKDAFGPVRFWHMHRPTFPKLFRIVLRIYAIPVSSCSSERVFSAVNRIVTRDRASLSSKTLEEIVITRSLLSDL